MKRHYDMKQYSWQWIIKYLICKLQWKELNVQLNNQRYNLT